MLKFSGTPVEKKANPYAVKPTIEVRYIHVYACIHKLRG